MYSSRFWLYFGFICAFIKQRIFCINTTQLNLHKSQQRWYNVVFGRARRHCLGLFFVTIYPLSKAFFPVSLPLFTVLLFTCICKSDILRFRSEHLFSRLNNFSDFSYYADLADFAYFADSADFANFYYFADFGHTSSLSTNRYVYNWPSTNIKVSIWMHVNLIEIV